MNKLIKIGAIGVALAFAMPSNAEVERYNTETGAIGYTAVAVALASPVALPWGLGIWDVYGIDMGILYNDFNEMYGLQFALANTDRGDVMGIVAGGLFNYAGKDVYGIRAALGVNLCNKTVYGWDIGGFSMHRMIYGIDTSLLGSMQENSCGLMIGGLCTLTEHEAEGVSLAGGLNLAKLARGAQVAGIFNQTDELHGCQIGLVNFARECPWGFQVGLVNIIMDNEVKVLPIVNAYF